MALADLPRRRIGSTTMQVPVLGFGAAHLGELYGLVPEAQSQATLQAAWDVGVRYFDTAPRNSARHATVRGQNFWGPAGGVGCGPPWS